MSFEDFAGEDGLIPNQTEMSEGFWEQEKQLTQDLITDLIYLKSLTNKEFLLAKKFDELMEFYKSTTIDRGNINLMLDNSMSYKDVADVILSNNVKIELKLCNGNDKLLEEWMMLRRFIHTLYFQQGGGRFMKYLVKINGKAAGLIAVTSDVISIGCRDKMIGWDRDTKHKNLGRICIGSTIVPVQPFGYLTAGGKLMALMFFCKQVREDWERLYGDKLVGCTTTSLYGINSQYNGMPKYWKTLGETSGEFLIFPSNKIYDRIRDWCNGIIKCDESMKIDYHNTMKPSKTSGMITNSKAKMLSFYFKRSTYKTEAQRAGLKKKDLYVGFKRGVYFAKLYNNTIDYLNDRTEASELVLRSNLDFDIGSPQEIFEYWKRKWGKNRYDKLIKSSDKKHFDQFYMDIEKHKIVEDFIKAYE